MLHLPPGGALMVSAGWQAVVSLHCVYLCVCVCVRLSDRRSAVEVNGQELLAQAVLAGGALGPALALVPEEQQQQGGRDGGGWEKGWGMFRRRGDRLWNAHQLKSI